MLASYHDLHMAIRFQCASCKQPIEIDDVWASRAVLCPFCRTTVGAPQTSTLTDLADIPSASPVDGSVVRHSAPLRERGGRPQKGNAVAVVAFALTWVGMLLGILAILVASPHALELQEFGERIQTATAQSKSQMQAMADYMNDHGGVMPGWWIACGVATMASGLSLLAATVCAVIGLFRPARRGFAVAALCICSALIGFVVVNSVVGVA